VQVQRGDQMSVLVETRQGILLRTIDPNGLPARLDDLFKTAFRWVLAPPPVVAIDRRHQETSSLPPAPGSTGIAGRSIPGGTRVFAWRDADGGETRTAAAGESWWTESDDDGAYALELPGPGRYTLRFESEEGNLWKLEWRGIEVHAERMTEIDVTLQQMVFDSIAAGAAGAVADMYA
jgi:hypothetical protein